MTTAVKERPILFSAPMVRAILDGRKTVTRRVVKTQPGWARRVESLGSTWIAYQDDFGRSIGRCPYGQPGDRLWVREAWGLYDTIPSDGPDNATVFYRATDGDRHELRYQRWRPSIHMPRWASRITLEVEAVRVERLQEITEEQAVAEGFKATIPIRCMPSGEYGGEFPAARMSFREIWKQLNGPESWDANPWVWVVQFRRVEL